MDDFLYNLRSGNIRRLDKTRRTYGNQQNSGHEWRNGNKKLYDNNESSEQLNNMLSDSMSAINVLLESNIELWKRIADAAERGVTAEERKADSLQIIAAAMAKLAGLEIDEPPENYSSSPEEKEEDRKSASEKLSSSEEEERKSAFEKSDTADEQHHKGKKYNNKAYPAKTRGKVMESITRLRNTGLSYGQIAKQLEKDKIPTLSGRGKWHASTIANILK